MKREKWWIIQARRVGDAAWFGNPGTYDSLRAARKELAALRAPGYEFRVAVVVMTTRPVKEYPRASGGA
jgi:hypothetical protein